MNHRHAIELLIQARIFCPAVVPEFWDDGGIKGYYVFSSMKVLGHGDTIGEAFDDARRNGHISGNIRWLPPFREDGVKVVRLNEAIGENETVATARSRNMAIRIANALNQYQPDERNQ